MQNKGVLALVGANVFMGRKVGSESVTSTFKGITSEGVHIVVSGDSVLVASLQVEKMESFDAIVHSERVMRVRVGLSDSTTIGNIAESVGYIELAKGLVNTTSDIPSAIGISNTTR